MVRTGKGDTTRYGEMVVPIFLIFNFYVSVCLGNGKLSLVLL